MFHTVSIRQIERKKKTIIIQRWNYFGFSPFVWCKRDKWKFRNVRNSIKSLSALIVISIIIILSKPCFLGSFQSPTKYCMDPCIWYLHSLGSVYNFKIIKTNFQSALHVYFAWCFAAALNLCFHFNNSVKEVGLCYRSIDRHRNLKIYGNTSFNCVLEEKSIYH